MFFFCFLKLIYLLNISRIRLNQANQCLPTFLGEDPEYDVEHAHLGSLHLIFCWLISATRSASSVCWFRVMALQKVLIHHDALWFIWLSLADFLFRCFCQVYSVGSRFFSGMFVALNWERGFKLCPKISREVFCIEFHEFEFWFVFGCDWFWGLTRIHQ